MATKKKKSNAAADIDWYLISIDRLKQIGLVVLLLILAGAGYWFWNEQKGNPKTKAESAIGDAKQALNALASSAEFAAHRSEFDRAQQKLDEANTHFTANRYENARDSAVESQTISRAALSGGGDLESDAQFLTIEGNVQYQKGQSSEWKDADPRTPLVNGDWVKTGARASAELIFTNGSIYTVGPNALLEIFSQTNPGTSEKSNFVQMRVGSIQIATLREASTVRTPGTQVVIDSDSTTHVGVDEGSKETSVISSKGTASVSPEQGGPAVKLASGEKISATPQGTLSPVKKLVLPPALLSPGDSQIFQLSPQLKVDLLWGAQEGATAYLLQVSRSRLFSTHEINTRRTNTSATTKVTEEGSFFWRVASVGPDGELGPFSPFRRFRVSGGKVTPEDHEAPRLVMKQPFHVGGPYYTIEGTTEAGATVFIADEEVDVDSNGAFRKVIGFDKVGRNTVVIKAVDAAGNSNVVSQTVLVEE